MNTKNKKNPFSLLPGLYFPKELERGDLSPQAYEAMRFKMLIHPLKVMLDEFRKTLKHLKTPLWEKDINKIYNLNAHGEREIVRDVLVFLYYYPLETVLEDVVKDKWVFIKKNGSSKKQRKILKKYDDKIPIVSPADITSYLPDVLMLAKIKPRPQYYFEFVHVPNGYFHKGYYRAAYNKPVNIEFQKNIV